MNDIRPKQMTDMGRDELRRIISLMESDDFINVLIPVLMDRQDKLIARLISKDDEQTRGRIKEVGDILALHDIAMKMVEESSDVDGGAEAGEAKDDPMLEK